MTIYFASEVASKSRILAYIDTLPYDTIADSAQKLVDAYADMFQRKAVLAFVASGDEKGELYGDVTINIPQYSLDEGESFLSSDCPDLIDAMVKNGYLEITDSVKLNWGTYKIGKFTQKFADEFENAA